MVEFAPEYRRAPSVPQSSSANLVSTPTSWARCSSGLASASVMPWGRARCRCRHGSRSRRRCGRRRWRWRRAGCRRRRRDRDGRLDRDPVNDPGPDRERRGRRHVQAVTEDEAQDRRDQVEPAGHRDLGRVADVAPARERRTRDRRRHVAVDDIGVRGDQPLILDRPRVGRARHPRIRVLGSIGGGNLDRVVQVDPAKEDAAEVEPNASSTSSSGRIRAIRQGFDRDRVCDRAPA